MANSNIVATCWLVATDHAHNDMLARDHRLK